MSRLPAFRILLLSASLVAGIVLVPISTQDANAQQSSSGNAAAQGGYSTGNYGDSRRRVGGYSVLTLSDIWGPAKMPPAPKDFGPHFDFPPQPLNGAPLHDPYPN